MREDAGDEVETFVKALESIKLDSEKKVSSVDQDEGVPLFQMTRRNMMFDIQDEKDQDKKQEFELTDDMQLEDLSDFEEVPQKEEKPNSEKIIMVKREKKNKEDERNLASLIVY